MKKSLKVLPDSSGVYRISNSITNRYYIGSTVNFRTRFNSHILELRQNKHHCWRLQRCFNKYGSDSFLFSIEAHCKYDMLLKEEQKYLDIGFDSGLILNSFRTAYSVCGENHPMYGKHHTSKSKQLIKEARAKQVVKHSIETRNKIALSNKGKKLSKDVLAKIAKTKIERYASGLIVPWNKGKNRKSDPRIKQPVNTIIIEYSVQENIIKLYLSGFSILGLAKKFDYTWDVVRRVLTDNNVTIRTISQQKIILNAKRNN